MLWTHISVVGALFGAGTDAKCLVLSLLTGFAAFKALYFIALIFLKTAFKGLEQWLNG